MILTTLIFSADFAIAAPALPTMMNGQTTATVNGQTIYGGMSGNYAILNTSPDSDYGLNRPTLIGAACTGTVLTGVTSPLCFFLGTGLNGTELNAQSSVKLMTSRTSINGSILYEIPALFLGGINISGDAFGNDYLSNFAFWGRNLAQGSGVTPENGATWWDTAYTLNPNAQSKWDSSQTQTYKSNIQTAKNEATVVEPTVLQDNADWYLQGTTMTDNSSADAVNHREGKIWKVSGNLTVSSKKTYHGIGTIIINGDMVFESGGEVVPSVEATDRLGIIVPNN